MGTGFMVRKDIDALVKIENIPVNSISTSKNKVRDFQ